MARKPERANGSMMQPDFKIGDHVLWLLDGDIGLVVDVDHPLADEPFKAAWYMNPAQSGWHSAYSDDHTEPSMVRLGGHCESR